MKSTSRRIGAVGLLLALVAMPHPALAYSANTKITSLVAWNDGHFVISFQDFPGNNACGSNLFSLGVPTDMKYKSLVTIAVVAFTTGKTVSVQTAPGSCEGGQEVVTNLQVLQ